MVSLIPAFDVEFFNSAYENIRLIANKTWAFDKDDPYRKLNEHLWIQNFKYFEKQHRKCDNRSSNEYNDISGSSIFQYDNHQYNVKCESLCSQNNHRTSAPDNAVNSYLNKSTTEPWMLNEVEECFTQLTSNIQLIKESHCSILNDDSSKLVGREIDHIKYCSLPYKIDNVAELQLQIRISHENIRHIWNINEVNQPTSLSSSSSSLSSSASLKNDKCDYPYYQPNNSNTNEKSKVLNCNEDIRHLQHQPVIIAKTRYKTRESKGQKNSTTVPLLSAEVPEFFPKGPEVIRDWSYDTIPPQHFLFPMEKKKDHEKIIHFDRPQLSNVHAVYQSPSSIPLIATPIMTPMMRPSYHHWIPHIPPPPPIPIPIGSLVPYSSISLQSICPVIHRPIQLHEKLMIQPGQVNIYERNNTAVPIPVYQRPPELYPDQKQRKRSQGVDFNNLILLTKNAMKARRNQSKNPQQSSSFILESRQPNLKSETDVLQWLNKGYPKRANEFLTINSLVSDLRDFEDICRINSDGSSKNPDLLQSIVKECGNYCDRNNDPDTGNYGLSIKHI